MGDFLDKNKTLILLNFLWIGIYFLFFCQLNLPINSKILFSTPDSQEYLKTGYEFFDLHQTGFSTTRPFLYPIFVRLVYGTFGAYALWFVQFLFWLASANLIFKSVQFFSKQVVFSFCISLLFCLNISLIVLTFHGLTELISVFLISILTFLICKNFNDLWSPKLHLKILLLFSLLAVIKPLFFPLVVATAGLILIVHFKYLFRTPKKIVQLLVILSPVILQLGMMKFKYDKWTVSTISDLTWRRYIATQVISDLHHFKPEESAKAEKIAVAMSPGELNAHFKTHFWLYYRHWSTNMHDNLGHEASLLLYPVGYEHRDLYYSMQSTNNKYRKTHSIFLVIFVLCAIIWIARKNYRPLLGTSALLLVCYYIFGTSGISFSQGDRLVITSLPLFFVAYAFLLYTLVDFLKEQYLKLREKRRIAKR